MRTAALLVLAAVAPLAGQTPLWLRGYSVIPTPQRVDLRDGDVALDGSWFVKSEGLPATHMAIRSLTQDLRGFHQYSPAASGAKAIQLAVKQDAVSGVDDPELRKEAYRLRIAADGIQITGNSDAGLFYGVQTLLQLVREGPRGTLLLPQATIEDWPRLQLRFLHWDTKNHQDRMETLQRYLDWSARMKVNMIGFELEDKFAYPSNPVIGAPGAFTPAELQEIVNYGLERFIQVVPVIQAPAHLSYVLKHPQFARLRADGNNYQAALCEEGTYKLIFQMYDDVIAATKGVDYLFVSTDEVYYAGIEGTCAPYNPETRSRRLAEFDRRARDHVASRGRRMLAWLEYPLLPKELETLPSDIIDGVMGEDGFEEIERRKGMRQLLYLSMQGSEFLFPDYLSIDGDLNLPAAEGEDPFEFERGSPVGRVTAGFRSVLNNRAMKVNPIGIFGAAWDDSGLHGETFWLGWSAAAQYGWNPGAVNAEQHIAEFMRFYYGPRVTGMTELYRTLQEQARAWQRSWDRVPSRVRGPGYGNSDGKGIGTARWDQTLVLPPLPAAGDLRVEPSFARTYQRYLQRARERRGENDRLVQALVEQMADADRNRYNLQVLAALARFIGHHWQLLETLTEAEHSLGEAQAAAAKGDARGALRALRSAHSLVVRTQREGEEVFRELIAVFEVSQFPKGQAVNGRAYVHVLDDTKDQWAARTADLGYMFAAERSMGLEEYARKLHTIAEQYARANGLPVPE
ncbi:MAG: beta-N-acetylhexosaminidase [Acidobacteriota bacterium]